MFAVENLFMKARWWLLDLLFPETCFGCHKKGELMCDNCIRRIKRVERETGGSIFAVFDYRDTIIKQAIWKLKYYGKITLGGKLGAYLYREMIEEISDMRLYSSGSPIVVIPVPISNTRKKKRGYNQAEEIAKGFCKESNEETLEMRNDLIRKNIDTKPQARIENRKERLKNIEGAFSIVDNEKIKGRSFIVIDDVTTTGGTMKEIIKVLKYAGAKKVIGMALAH